MLATIEKACVLNGAQPHGYESTFGEVSSYIARLSGSPLYSESYVRDNLGRITQRTEVLEGVTTVWGYGYDVSGRLSSVTRNGAAFESYTFDSNDNRLTKTTVAGTTTYAHDDQDRLLSAVGPGGAESWVYDGHGDLLSHNGSAGQTSFNYETGGQLLSVTKPGGDVVSYELDAGNKRAVKRVNGVVQRQWVYAGGLLPVAELDGSGNLVAVFNGGFMVKNGTTYRLLRDHLGSVRMVVDTSTGAVVQRLSYDAWGNVLEDTNPGFQPFGYAGGLYDPDTGLVRFGARDYDPGIGRWTCKDPIGLDGGINLYAYCGAEPTNRVDRDGLLLGDSIVETEVRILQDPGNGNVLIWTRTTLKGKKPVPVTETTISVKARGKNKGNPCGSVEVTPDTSTFFMTPTGQVTRFFTVRKSDLLSDDGFTRFDQLDIIVETNSLGHEDIPGSEYYQGIFNLDNNANLRPRPRPLELPVPIYSYPRDASTKERQYW